MRKKRRFDIPRKQVNHLASVFSHSLESALHVALIEALEATADIQNRHPNVGKQGFMRASCKPEPHDGFYTYRGSIDTTYVAEYLDMVAQRWMSQKQKRAA